MFKNGLRIITTIRLKPVKSTKNKQQILVGMHSEPLNRTIKQSNH